MRLYLTVYSFECDEGFRTKDGTLSALLKEEKEEKKEKKRKEKERPLRAFLLSSGRLFWNRLVSARDNDVLCGDQPSASGGVTQPYFSCVFTRLLNDSSANWRLYSLVVLDFLVTCAY